MRYSFILIFSYLKFDIHTTTPAHHTLTQIRDRPYRLVSPRAVVKVLVSARGEQFRPLCPHYNANQSTPPVKALVQIPFIDAPVTYTDCLHTRHTFQILRTTVSQSGSQPCHTQLQHCRIRQSRCPLPDRRYARRRRWLMSFSLVPVTERESCAHHVRPELHVEPELHGISLHSYFLVNTIPTGMGVDVNVKILDSFATHVAPALGWLPNREGPVTGYLID